MADLTPDRSVLSAYLDGALEPGELDRVVELLRDPEAAAEFKAVREAKRVLRALPAVEPPAWVLSDDHEGDRLSAYLDGELPTEEAAAIVTHLTTCRRCREELHDLDRSRTAVRSLPGLEVPGLPIRPDAPRRSHLRPVRPRAMVAATAGLVAVLALLTTITSRPPDPGVTLVDLEARHVTRMSVEPGAGVFPPVLGEVGP